MTQETFPSRRLADMLREGAQRSSRLHEQFLRQRLAGLGDIQALLAGQIRQAGNGPLNPAHPPACPALFDSRHLDEFGTGQLSRCLGPAFAAYDRPGIPRIPNGDLKMMTRVTGITGTPRDFTRPAEVVVEYDVPADAWYFRDTTYPRIPYALWMEIALQPCGFLSAYLDTYALVPHGEFNFRNLDGYASLSADMDVRGKTLVTHARLLTSVASAGTVIQKYAFVVRCDGTALYQGESTFGYFSVETMANQVGLDGGRTALPWLRAEGAGRATQPLDMQALRNPAPGKPFFHLPGGRLHFLDDVVLTRDGGLHGRGTLYARRPVNPADWFYPFHFYQDPVMPGSLGVEAVLEAMQAYALAADLGAGFRSPRVGLSEHTEPMTWRYRGQITPRHNLMELEVHLRAVERLGQRVRVSGDASVWIDGLRIYEIKNAAVAIMEG